MRFRKKKKEAKEKRRTVTNVKRVSSSQYPYEKKRTDYSDGTFTVSKWRAKDTPILFKS